MNIVSVHKIFLFQVKTTTDNVTTNFKRRFFFEIFKRQIRVTQKIASEFLTFHVPTHIYLLFGAYSF